MTEDYKHPEQIQSLFDDIESLNNHIRYMETQIYKSKNLIKEKYKLIHNLCDHDWEDKRENYMYGEKYQECRKCGMCR